MVYRNYVTPTIVGEAHKKEAFYTCNKCKKTRFIHKLMAYDTSKTAKKLQKGDITHQYIA